MAALLRRPHRLIPAHAGKTFCEKANTETIWAHPRSRGENGMTIVPSDSISGSSPLTRGKPRGVLATTCGAGLIPAHAGKTRLSVSTMTSGGAHPRSRGENCSPATGVSTWGGSSPLTRGKRVPGAEVRGSAGLIPAHAGKTTRRRCPAFRSRAHPRSRGENVEQVHTLVVREGSSPLTRGKLRHAVYHLPDQRLIPAHAGKTSSCHGRSPRQRAHPRSRGENQRYSGRRPHDYGLIPAHAGKTSKGSVQ